ncbi:MAG: ubiquinone-dependent pyruvate dehydrogenase [Sphingobacteriales bacterium]|nr:MAG: ubiquinone-dependent pyruvate dehydrogenase [Sphingobacteriales bacterium]
MARTVADQLVDTLLEAGINRLYAVTGDSLNHVNDAVRRTDGRFQWIHVRHEETGAYAAAAEAELNGIACCAGSSGPGHVHLINGLYDAHRSGASVIAIASTIESHQYGTGYFQETNTLKLFDDCSGYNQIAFTPVQFTRMLQSALQHTWYQKQVAVLGLPGDLTTQEADEGPTSLYLLKSKARLVPDDSEIRQLADLINGAEKITLFCGLGARDAHAEFVQLSQRVKAPVGYSFRGKMSTQYNNPNEVGMNGLLGIPSGLKSMEEAELLILLGTDFPYEQFMPKDIKIVQIDVRPERIGRRGKIELGLAGDIKATLEALLPLVAEKTDDSFLQTQLAFYRKCQERLLSYAEDKGERDRIAPEFVAHTIDQLAAPNAIFTVDTGMSCVWAARYLHATGQRDMLGSFNHGSMANAMPQAIGAALARPGQQVIAFCGDGGLSMLLGDLATIVQYKLPIKIVVFNNHSLGMVKLEMQVAGLPDWQTDMVNPDFAKIAEAFGMRGINVHEPGDVPGALQDAFNYDGPVLVNIFTNPDALAMPPEIEFKQVKGYLMSMGKLVLSGRMDEVMDQVKTNLKHVKDAFL